MRAPQKISQGETKAETYARLESEILAVLDGEANVTAQMATIACLLHDAFTNRIWTGFYGVDPDKPDELVVGPYQGTLGCLRIKIGKGVCGVAAAQLKTQLVEDVHQFEGHIACDSRTLSEIVVPVLDRKGALIAVLDIDSDVNSAFDEVDQRALESLIGKVFA